MSTKSTIILTDSNNEHIFFDSQSVFSTKNEKYAEEISFEFSKKNIRIDINDNEDLCFSLDKNSEIYRFFSQIFREKLSL